MKSNEELDVDFNNIPDESKLIISKNMVGHGLERVLPKIDKFTSSKLKKVLKAVSMVFLAEQALDIENDLDLVEDEQKLIDDIFALQETVIGHTALVNELKQKEEDKEINAEVNLEQSLEVSNE